MGQVLAAEVPVSDVVAKGAVKGWDWNAKATIISALAFVLLTVLGAVGTGVWTLANRISDTRDQVRTELKEVEAGLTGKVEKLGDRVSALETKISALDAGLRGEREQRGQERGALEQRLGKLQTDQQQTEQRVAGVARSDVARALALAEVMQLEQRIAPLFRPTTRVMVGTLTSVVLAERVLAIETREGKSRAFVIAEEVVAKGFCGGMEERLMLTDIKRGTPILVAYDTTGTRNVARIVAKSSCA